MMGNRNQGRGYRRTYQDESEDDSEDEDEDANVQARVRKLSNLKRNAIDVTTDVIVAENLLRRHGDDSGLLMYKERCSQEMFRALDKLPVASHGAQVKRPYTYSGNTGRYTGEVV